MPSEEKGKEGNNQSAEQKGARGGKGSSAPPKAEPGGRPGGISLTWVIIVAVLMLAEGIYITAHSARQIGKLSDTVAELRSRAEQSQRLQLALAADRLEEAARYASEENYGLQEQAANEALAIIRAAAALDATVRGLGLRALESELEKAQRARGSAAASALTAISERVREAAEGRASGAGRAGVERSGAGIGPGAMPRRNG